MCAISLSFGGASSLIFLSVEREMAGMAYCLFCLMINLTNDMHSCSDKTSSETYSDVLSTLLPSQSMRTSQFVTVSTAYAVEYDKVINNKVKKT